MSWYSVYFPGLPFRRPLFYQDICAKFKTETAEMKKNNKNNPWNTKTYRNSNGCPQNSYLIDNSILFKVSFENISITYGRLHWKCLICFLARKDLYRATPAMTKNLGLQGLIHRTYPVYSSFTASNRYGWPVWSESPRMPIFYTICLIGGPKGGVLTGLQIPLWI